MQPNPSGHSFLRPRLWDGSVNLHLIPIHFMFGASKLCQSADIPH